MKQEAKNKIKNGINLFEIFFGIIILILLLLPPNSYINISDLAFIRNLASHYDTYILLALIGIIGFILYWSYFNKNESAGDNKISKIIFSIFEGSMKTLVGFFITLYILDLIYYLTHSQSPNETQWIIMTACSIIIYSGLFDALKLEQRKRYWYLIISLALCFLIIFIRVIIETEFGIKTTYMI